MKKLHISWQSLLIGIVWFAVTTFYFISYQSGTLSESITVPRIISWVYDLFGFMAGTIVQWILSLIFIIGSIRPVKVDKNSDFDDEDEE
mgnify:FL=1|jgi:hypothetical protein